MLPTISILSFSTEETIYEDDPMFDGDTWLSEREL